MDFASTMLQWIPEDRVTAKGLLRHPFPEAVDKCFVKDYEQEGWLKRLIIDPCFGPEMPILSPGHTTIAIKSLSYQVEVVS